MRQLLLCALCALVLCVVAQPPAFQWANLSPESSPFTVDSLNIAASDGGAFPRPYTNATVVFKGRIPAHGNLTSGGRVELDLWEGGVNQFVYHSNILYFNCDPHGCYPNQPNCLFLDNPNDPSSYSVSVSFPMPAAQATGNYTLNLVGQEPAPSWMVDFALAVMYVYPTA